MVHAEIFFFTFYEHQTCIAINIPQVILESSLINALAYSILQRRQIVAHNRHCFQIGFDNRKTERHKSSFMLHPNFYPLKVVRRAREKLRQTDRPSMFASSPWYDGDGAQCWGRCQTAWKVSAGGAAPVCLAAGFLLTFCRCKILESLFIAILSVVVGTHSAGHGNGPTAGKPH